MKLPGIPSRSSPAEEDHSQRQSCLPTLLPRCGPRLPSFGRGSKGANAEEGCLKDSVSKEDFQVLRHLGEGGYAKVKLVRHRSNGLLYAMKIVEKSMLLDRRYAGDVHAEARAQAERDIGMAAYEADCPFLVRLCASFQTPETLCYILEYCEGGELFEKLRSQPGGRFVEGDACFYAAEICLALQHLHQRDTVHRDVRLENVLVCKDGHIKLADFGIAKTEVSPTGQRPSHIFNFANAQAQVYFPPEFHEGECYGKDLDCWQLGVATFAMLAGRLPEGLGSERWPGELPEDASAEAGAFCAALLREDRQQRLGYPQGAEQLLPHSFFAATDWDALARKELTAVGRLASNATEASAASAAEATPRGWWVADLFRMSRFSFTGSVFMRRSSRISRSRRTSMESCPEDDGRE